MFPTAFHKVLSHVPQIYFRNCGCYLESNVNTRVGLSMHEETTTYYTSMQIFIIAVMNIWTSFSLLCLRLSLRSNASDVGRFSASEVESYITTNGQSASLSWNKAPIWGLRLDSYYCETDAGLLDVVRSLWREDGSVVYNCCWSSPAQSSSGPSPVGIATIFYCLRFETSPCSPIRTRRATVEVFYPASTRDDSPLESESTDGQSASLSWNKATIRGLRPDLDYCLTVAGMLMWGALSVVYSCCWPSPAQSFSGPLLSQIWDFPFRRLLRLAGLRWMYSTPPPHGRDSPLVYWSTLCSLGLAVERWLVSTASLPCCTNLFPGIPD
jgi:hypothetical protein